MNHTYDSDYYASYKTGLGLVSYGDRSIWEPGFTALAEEIINRFHPHTVLDAGCAFGYLVEALRDRGVEAYGIDISEYAVSCVREDIRPYCVAGSLADPLPEELPGHFDLVVTVEVLEHLTEADGERAIHNLCQLSDTVLFSSSPDDFDEPTHVNVRQKEYWTDLFLKEGFSDDLFGRPDWLSRQAILFRREELQLRTIVSKYEHFLRCKEYQKEEKPSGIVFFDTGDGFSAEDIVTLSPHEGSFVSQRLMLPAGCRSIRYDPMENCGCLAWNVCVRTDESILSLHSHNGVKLRDAVAFRTNDPQMVFPVDTVAPRWAEISLHVLPMDNAGWTMLCQAVEELREEISAGKRENEALEQQFSRQLSEQLKCADKLQEEIARLEADNKSGRRENAELLETVRGLRTENGGLRAENANIGLCLQTITEGQIWRMTKPLRVCLDLMKKLLRGAPAPAQVVAPAPAQEGAPASAPVPVQVTTPDKPVKIGERFPITGNPVDPIAVIRSPDFVKRLNLVTDSISAGSLLGGVATSLILAAEFANRYGYALRIITRNEDCEPGGFENILRISGVKAPENVTFYSDYDRRTRALDFKLELSEGDVFLATSWWSAKAIENTIPGQRFFYIIQEVESFFYNYGGEHLLCSQMMHSDHIDYIVNSHYLAQYFEQHEPNITVHGCSFEPAFPGSLYKCGEFGKKEHFRLFFYARPNNPRNLFSFGLSMLDKAIELGILDTGQWEICCVGQDVPEITFCNGAGTVNMGRMDWEAYAEFLSEVDLGLCLMYTPHPSYPPYDVACSGGVVLSNRMENKTSFEECGNVILADLDEKAFLEDFRKAVALAMDPEKRRKNYENSTIRKDWHETLEGTLTFMENCLHA